MYSKPKVLVVATGGTILSTIKEDGSYSPSIDKETLLEKIQGLKDIAEIEYIQYCNVLSFALTPQMIFQLVKLMKEKLESDVYRGAVVIQGTATIEETSYLADLLWDLQKPVVFTGAMRNASELDWDGARNIRDSVVTAISDESRDKGVLVCMAGEIHTARDVSKMHKTSTTAFYSINSGPIGIIKGSTTIFYRSPLRRKTFRPEKLEDKIDIIKISIGIDSRLLEASIKSGVKGIVLEVFPGGGGVTPEIADTVRKAITGDIIFVATPRSPMGSLNAKAGGGCGPWDLKTCGVIMGGDLTSVKARAIMMAALSDVKSRQELEQIFAEIAP